MKIRNVNKEEIEKYNFTDDFKTVELENNEKIFAKDLYYFSEDKLKKVK